MTPADSLRQALHQVRAQPRRSVLTLFGLVWGTAAVVFLSAWGEGVGRMSDAALERAGRNLIQAFPGRISEQFSPAASRRWLWYTPDDVEALRHRARLPELVAGETRGRALAVFRQRTESIELRGVEPDGIAIRGVRAAVGRLITRPDLDLHRRVAVIGHQARIRLLGAEGGVGSMLRLDGIRFEVVGVLDRVGTQLSRDGDSIDEQIWVPLSTYFDRWPDARVQELALSSILVRMRDRSLLDATEEEVRGVLAERLGVARDDTEAVPLFSPVATLRSIPIEPLNFVNFLISAATTLIAGIGVFSLMTDSVRERRSEIAVRMALGATRREVLLQFFLETMFLVMLGGVAGMLLGLASTWLLGSSALRSGIPPALADLIPVPVLRPPVVIAAAAVLAATGVLAAIPPAHRASRLDPAVILRSE